MNKNKKTCFIINCYKTNQKSVNKNLLKVKNKIMIKKQTDQLNISKQSECSIHVMPPQITDADITALFNGVVCVVKKKIELENKAEIINANLNIEKLLKALKEKEAECVRLKNEIIYLKSKL